jgi:hypothetical protein
MKLNHMVALTAFFVASTAMSHAAPVCLTTASLSSLIALGSGGCEIGDKVYNNFTYSTGAGNPTSAQVNVGVDNQTGILQTGLQFGTSAGVWTNPGFTIGYTITVDPAQCVILYGAGNTCAVRASQLAFQGALAGATNTAALTATFSGASPGSLSVNDLATGNNVNQNAFAPFWTTSDIVITGSGNSTTFPIDSFGLDVYQQVTSSVPEPATVGLVGGVLLGLGALRSKLSRP